MATESDDIDLVTVGETMVVFSGRPDSTTWTASPAGAESNVAAALASLGHRSRWVSRLGDDHLGRFVADEIASRGVDVDVEWDRERPTGVMTKVVVDGATERQYFRSTSAARALSPLDRDRVRGARHLHLTGITPAISSSAAALVESLVGDRPDPDGFVSFDVNLRPALWPRIESAAAVLVPLAHAADLVLIGDDEARALLGTDEVGEVADRLLRRRDQELVLKRGAGPSTLVREGLEVTVPALATPVIDPTGAGDAFAAGYLAGRIRSYPHAACLRLGHALAARVLGVLTDVVPPFTAAELSDLTPEVLERRWADAPST